jgi:tRNA nucleotidyltransferase (CCA-adding enzyme)
LGGDATVHPAFRTATWTDPTGLAVDLATARTETYARPAVLPEVKPAPLADDLRRRDFSINTLALRVDGEHLGELLDPHGGQADLAARVIRILHPLSFQDDPTRLFRAVRYEQRLNFHLAPDTLALFPGAWEALAAVTGDRVRHEFELIFREPQVAAILTRLAELGVLPRVHPALHWGASESAKASAIPQLSLADWRIASPPTLDAFFFSLLLGGASAPETFSALARLNVNKPVFQAVTEAVALQPAWPHPSEAVTALDGLSELGVIAAHVLHVEARPALDNYLARWRFIKAHTTGDDLIKSGLKPGPEFKKILWTLRAAWLDGEVNDDKGEKTLLARLLNTDKVTG